MEIEYLKRFVTLADTLNFRKTADIHFISQPTLSHSINNLEKGLNTQLLLRNTKSVSLTKEGVKFLPYAREIVRLYDEGAGLFSGNNNDDTFLSIGYVGPELDDITNRWLKELYRQFPNAMLDLIHLPGVRIKDAFEDQTIQLALMYEEYIADIPDVKYEVIESEQYKLLINKSHPLALRDSVSLKEIVNEPFIIWGKSSAAYFREIVLSLFEKQSLKPTKLREISQIGDVYRQVSLGMGVAIMSFPENSDFGSYDIKLLDIEEVDEVHNKVMAWREALTPLAKRLRLIIRENPQR